MSTRETVLSSIRRSLGVTGAEAPRRSAAAMRILAHPRGPVPARGTLDKPGRVALFAELAEAAGASVAQVAGAGDVPAQVSAYLRSQNLPMRVKMGDDKRLAAMPWASEKTLDIARGRSDGQDIVAVSHALGGVAESGTLVLLSGADNPTTLNFLPETHIVVVRGEEIAGDYETLWDRIRETFGKGLLPRAVNWVTGPSRSADIEQTMLYGAHGPRRLHVIVAG